MEYASNGKANAGLATGIVGTSLAGLLWANGNGGGLGNILGGRGTGCYSQTYDGKISQLESEIAFLRGENYADKVANEVYRSLDERMRENMEKVYNFVIDLDKRTALNAQGLAYENQITNQKIDCCCEKSNMQMAFNRQLAEIADANILSYVNGTFVPGKLVMPITSVCPTPAVATPTTTG